jgi:hypothetical protein
VVGLSNVFSGDPGADPLFPGCVRLALELIPGVPIADYEGIQSNLKIVPGRASALLIS